MPENRKMLTFNPSQPLRAITTAPYPILSRFCEWVGTPRLRHPNKPF
jgi:hypothetical protein